MDSTSAGRKVRRSTVGLQCGPEGIGVLLQRSPLWRLKTRGRLSVTISTRAAA